MSWTRVDFLPIIEDFSLVLVGGFCMPRGWRMGGGGPEEGGWRRRYGGYIGVISRMYTKTPHRYMTQMNRRIMTILLHDNCGWITTYTLT